MNTAISIDDDLINEVLELGTVNSKNELFELALRDDIENQKKPKKLAESFLKARQETEQLVAKQKLVLGVFLKRKALWG